MDDKQRAEAAAAESVDPDRLLAGEDPESSYLDDATHWARVYSELLEVKRDLLRVVEERLSGLKAEARREVASTDLVVLDAEMKRFARRHEFWRDRCEDLAQAST